MNDDRPTAYPLHWPISRPRTPPEAREEASFRKVRKEYRQANQTTAYNSQTAMTISIRNQLSASDGAERLVKELERFGARDIVISTNIERRLNGIPRKRAAEPSDPGVAVYFRLHNLPHCLATDKWTRTADNLAAIAKHIEATRGQIRWGTIETNQAFANVRLLSAVGIQKSWWEILGVSRNAPLPTIEARWRALIVELHPDRVGDRHGNRAAEINAAMDEARAAAETRAYATR